MWYHTKKHHRSITKKRGRKYAYYIIRKAYWINEKKIEMLDFEKNKRILRDYVENFECKRR